MSESKYQKKIIDRMELLGYYVLKLVSTNKNGIPDLLCLKHCDVIFIEVKGEKGKPSPLQLYRQQELLGRNFKSLISYEGDDFLTTQYPKPIIGKK